MEGGGGGYCSLRLFPRSFLGGTCPGKGVPQSMLGDRGIHLLWQDGHTPSLPARTGVPPPLWLGQDWSTLQLGFWQSPHCEWSTLPRDKTAGRVLEDFLDFLYFLTIFWKLSWPMNCFLPIFTKTSHSSPTTVKHDVLIFKVIGSEREGKNSHNSIQILQEMRSLRNWIMDKDNHKHSNAFALTALCHGTRRGHLLDKYQNKAWDTELFVADLSDVETLKGKPKILVINSCRGSKRNLCFAISSSKTFFKYRG